MFQELGKVATQQEQDGMHDPVILLPRTIVVDGKHAQGLSFGHGANQTKGAIWVVVVVASSIIICIVVPPRNHFGALQVVMVVASGLENILPKCLEQGNLDGSILSNRA